MSTPERSADDDMTEAERERLIEEMQPPDLHALIRRHGGYANIPPVAWKAFDEAKRGLG